MCNAPYEKSRNLQIERFPIFCLCSKIWGNVWTRHVSRHPAGRFFSHLGITLYKSLGTNYKSRNLIGKMRSFRTDRLITDTWFSREIAYFSDWGTGLVVVSVELFKTMLTWYHLCISAIYTRQMLSRLNHARQFMSMSLPSSIPAKLSHDFYISLRLEQSMKIQRLAIYTKDCISIQ